MKKRYGAVDIGGTKICVGIVQDDGIVLWQESFPTPLEQGGGEHAVEKIASLLEINCTKENMNLSDLSGIGIVCTGPVNVKTGNVENPYTLEGWGTFPIVEKLQNRTNLKVLLENDANGALLGEVALQKIQNKRVLILTFGTGIGVAFWDEQKVYRCKNGTHPEMGHILISLEGEQCYCGNKGCFEKQCSGTSLNERSSHLGFTDFDDAYLQSEISTKAKEFVQRVTDEIINGVLSLCAVFHPEVVILGGGFAKKYFSMIENAVSHAAKDKKDFVGSFTLVEANKIINPALVGTLMLFA